MSNLGAAAAAFSPSFVKMYFKINPEIYNRVEKYLHAEEICCIGLRSSSDIEVEIRKFVQIDIIAARRVHRVKVERSANLRRDIHGIRRGLEKATVRADLDLVPGMIPNPDCVVSNRLCCGSKCKA